MKKFEKFEKLLVGIVEMVNGLFNCKRTETNSIEDYGMGFMVLKYCCLVYANND